jgi:hypothetical protein
MRIGILFLSMVAATTQASESHFNVVAGPVEWEGLARLLATGSSETGMMVALATATVLFQFVRKYRAFESGRTRMSEYAMLKGGAAGPTQA